MDNLSEHNKSDSKAADDNKTPANGTFEDANHENYEGGNLGSAGSGTMEISATPTSTENENSKDVTDSEKANESITKDDAAGSDESYEGGNMGTAGSGSMDTHHPDSKGA